ncbi:MAG TPA: gliding motility-associated C-terminal domain-containing protein, partial [Ohtaekwangia sp.]|nr:gliding motility-associated C-terminal domain-containing protein [Ohtaekwangia sp.]
GAFNFPLVSQAGNYTIGASTALSCSSTMTGATDVTLSTAPTGAGSVNGGTQLCIGQEATYTVSGVSGATTFTWELPSGIEPVSPSVTASITVTAVSAASGVIRVVPSNACGNGLPAQRNVSTLPQPDVEITLPENVFAEKPAAFAFTSSVNPSGIAWTFGDGQGSSEPDPVITYASAGSFEVNLTITDNNGCVGTNTKALAVDPKATLGDLSVKNVVTANADGDNDFLFIDNIHEFPGNEVSVFDRWGVEVFRRKDYANDWDFRKGDAYLPAGNYVCVVKFNGKVFSRAITVLKQQ